MGNGRARSLGDGAGGAEDGLLKKEEENSRERLREAFAASTLGRC